ncbi:hypothetical protein AB0M46_31970 [Dactylosporangium sp. NPDC051485]|uniref:hypothetical protein n=1 Tax=Dactylosporangium sp. NPDC051485 TaxID=3154846 RepID=UPI00342AD8FB
MAANRRPAAVAVIALAMLAMVGGCGWDAGRAAQPAPASASVDAPANPVYFAGYAADDGAASTVVLTGGIGDYGTGLTVGADGKTDPEHRGQLRLTLKQGSFQLDTAALDGKVVTAFGHLASNATCSAKVEESAAVPVVAGSGTGAYRGITGTFDLTITILEDFPAGRCDATAPPLAEAVFITGSGRVGY